MEVLRKIPKEEIRRADKELERGTRFLAAKRRHFFDVEIVKGNPRKTVVIRTLDDGSLIQAIS